MNIFLLLLLNVEIPNNLFYLKVNSFTQADYNSAENLIHQRLTKPEKIDGIILDLRDNPGGGLIFARKFCEFWIPQDDSIFEVTYLDNSKVYYISQNPAPVFQNIPTVILVNNKTASSAEIVSLSLKYHQQAIIIGQRTGGHYKVKSGDPEKKYISWTVGYWTVHNLSSKRGLKPDFLIKSPERQSEKAVEYFRERSQK